MIIEISGITRYKAQCKWTAAACALPVSCGCSCPTVCFLPACVLVTHDADSYVAQLGAAHVQSTHNYLHSCMNSYLHHGVNTAPVITTKIHCQQAKHSQYALSWIQKRVRIDGNSQQVCLIIHSVNHKPAGLNCPSVVYFECGDVVRVPCPIILCARALVQPKALLPVYALKWQCQQVEYLQYFQARLVRVHWPCFASLV